LFGVPFFAVFFLICGVAFAAKTYPDGVGDVEVGTGPDIASVTVSNTATNVTFCVRSAKTPPLRVNDREGWIDMLLIGVDVPPLGRRPVVPGGEWRGANFAIGTHGPSRTGVLVRLWKGESRHVARLEIGTSRSTLVFSVPRRALGDPAWFTFAVAAAREREQGTSEGGVDVSPARGTFRYSLTG
jgi:hypothetical protein